MTAEKSETERTWPSGRLDPLHYKLALALGTVQAINDSQPDEHVRAAVRAALDAVATLQANAIAERATRLDRERFYTIAGRVRSAEASQEGIAERG